MSEPSVLVLTPVRDATAHLERYVTLLERLDHPRRALRLGLLEGDSEDGTFEALEALRPRLERRFDRVTLARRHYGLRMPAGIPRWAPHLQIPRRSVLAKCRNVLLSCALTDEEWVLWVDVDLDDYPPDVLRRLMAADRDVVAPHVVTRPAGPTFDWNSWRDQGRVRLDGLRGGPELVRLDAVGTAMLLVRAEVHREGLVFPTFLYGGENRFARDPNPWTGRGKGELESEGLGLMAKDMGRECWGMPGLEVVHRNE